MSTKYIQNFNVISCEEVKGKNKRERFQSAYAKSPHHDYKIPEQGEKNVETKFYSTSSIPSTVSSDKQSSFKPFLSVAAKPQRRGCTKKRIIFKSKHKRRGKSSGLHFLNEKDVAGHILNMKVNFFYKPYIGQNNIHDEPPMNFNEQSTEEQDSEYFNKEAQGNWKRLSGTILRKDDEEFRNFLKSIGKCKNEEVLDELIKKKSCASERKENGAKESHYYIKNKENITQGIKELLFSKIRAHCSQPPLTRRKNRKFRINSKNLCKETEHSNNSSYFSNSSKKVHSKMFNETMANSWKNEEFFTKDSDYGVKYTKRARRSKFLSSICSFQNQSLMFPTPQEVCRVPTTESCVISSEISKLESKQEQLTAPVLTSRQISKSPIPNRKLIQ